MPVNLRRDESANQFAFHSYQDAADMTDVLLSGSRRVTETLTTTAAGLVTVTNKPVLDITHDSVSSTVSGVTSARSRIINNSDVTAVRTVSGAAIFVGTVNGAAGTATVYSDSGLTTPLASTSISITYSTPVFVAVDANGNLSSALSGAVDISDRAARLLGVTDPSDRAGRLLGVVASIAGALPAGTNNIGDVDVLTLPALSAGTNNIGDVDVLTLPALPAGSNIIGATRTASVRGVWYDDDTSTIALPPANATGTGPNRDVFGAAAAGLTIDAYSRIQAHVWANQAGFFGLAISRDLVTWRMVERVATTALTTGENAAKLEVPITARGWRVFWTSGATPPTVLTVTSGMVAT
jgi:hypothetical protein